ncbi:MAG TPA: hypothetical protein VGM37_11645 [Armatimonadota bacterium]|jgi:hypothetical protein
MRLVSRMDTTLVVVPLVRSAARALALVGAAALLSTLPARCQVDLYRASLHAHTAYSDGDIGGAGGPTAQTPTTAAAAAKAAGLTAFAVSDHGEYIAPDVWTSTMSQMTGVTVPGYISTPGTFVGFWGFEWTNCTASAAPAPSGTPGGGHMNIYGSSIRGGARNVKSGDADKALIASIWWQGYWGYPTTAQSLYQWVLDHATSPLGGSIVVQMNHPNFYPGGTLANPTLGCATDWWRKMEWVPLLDPYVCLMELGSHAEPGSRAPTGYMGGAYNEPYFQVALDNGWHVAPTNSEDNHTDSYGSLRSSDGILTDTGVWAVTTKGLTPQRAEASFLAALRSRRIFAAEDKAPTHAGAVSLKFFVTPVGKGARWMGSRDFDPADVRAGYCTLQVTRTAGLLIDGGSIQVITNRGAVAKTLGTGPFDCMRVGTTAIWNFHLDGAPVPAQLRTVNTAVPAGIQQKWDINPLPWGFGPPPLVVHFDASASGRAERYYYVRVKQSDGTYAFSAPVWLKRDVKIAGGDDGVRPPRAANVVSYTWDFGDGSKQVESAAAADDGLFDGFTRHTYSVWGTYYPRVTVKYADGTTDVSINRVIVGTSTPPPFYGDVNGDGQINRDDITMLAKIVAGVLPVDAATLARANVYPRAGADANNPTTPGGSSKLDLADAIRLQRFLSGKEAVWP